MTTNNGATSSANKFNFHFSTLKDPRRTSKGNIIFRLEEILFLTISAVVSGCFAWDEIAEFGRLKKDWFRKFYPYSRMPSHDTISRLFSVLDSKKFSECFINWINDIASKTDSDVVAIDGKAIRGVASNDCKFPVHIVTAFCTENSLCLGQEAVSEKSNEIVAIPRLLELLTLDGCTVTIDAIGCQTKIAEKIREKNAHYILQVKSNQRLLKEQIVDIFNSNLSRKTAEKFNVGHGRIEHRICEVILVKDTLLEGQESWKDLNTIIRIESHRTIKKTGVKSSEFRYYISSKNDNAKQFNKSIRSHWGIENKLHWTLDVVFKEDGQLKRSGNSAQNFSIVCKTAIGLLDNEKTINKSKPIKRRIASIDDSYRELILKV